MPCADTFGRSFLVKRSSAFVLKLSVGVRLDPLFASEVAQHRGSTINRIAIITTLNRIAIITTINIIAIINRDLCVVDRCVEVAHVRSDLHLRLGSRSTFRKGRCSGNRV